MYRIININEFYDDIGLVEEFCLVVSVLKFLFSFMVSSSITLELQLSIIGEMSDVSDSMDVVLPNMRSVSERTVPNRTRRRGLLCFLFFSDDNRLSLPTET